MTRRECRKVSERIKNSNLKVKNRGRDTRKEGDRKIRGIEKKQRKACDTIKQRERNREFVVIFLLVCVSLTDCRMGFKRLNNFFVFFYNSSLF